MKKLAFLPLFFLSAIMPASADVKIAVLDLSKAFDQYYKTVEVQKLMTDEINTDNRQLGDLQTDYQKQVEAAKDLQNLANDSSLSQEARDEKASELKKKEDDIISLQQQIEQMRKSKANELQSEQVQNHNRIVGEITKVVTDLAQSKGYELVVDRSGMSNNGAPVLLYVSPSTVDITSDVITRLNANAPVGTAPSGMAH